MSGTRLDQEDPSFRVAVGLHLSDMMYRKRYVNLTKVSTSMERIYKGTDSLCVRKTLNGDRDTGLRSYQSSTLLDSVYQKVLADHAGQPFGNIESYNSPWSCHFS